MSNAAEQPPTPTYYRSSNRVGRGLWLALPVAGGGAALVLGLLYAFLSGLVTEVFEAPWLFAILTPMFGAGLAGVAQWVCRLGEVRQRRLRLPIALFIGALGLYFSWHVYLNLATAAGSLVPPPSWAMSPLQVVRDAGQLALANGVVGSALSWLLEAAVVFGMIAFMMREQEREIPYCEKCAAWTTEAFNFELGAGDDQLASERLRRGDAAGLAKLSPHKRGDTLFTVVRVDRCPCAASRYVSVDRAKFSRGKSAGVRYGTLGAGFRPRFYFDPGSGNTTDFTPVLANLVIDAATEHQLEAVRSKHAKG